MANGGLLVVEHAEAEVGATLAEVIELRGEVGKLWAVARGRGFIFLKAHGLFPFVLRRPDIKPFLVA